MLCFVLRLCFIQRQGQEIKYVEKSLAIYNSYVLMGSKILNTRENLLSAHMLCTHSSLIFCYQKCISLNPFLDFYQHFFKFKLFMDCNLSGYYPADFQNFHFAAYESSKIT